MAWQLSFYIVENKSISRTLKMSDKKRVKMCSPSVACASLMKMRIQMVITFVLGFEFAK